MSDVPIRINLFSDTVTRPGPDMRRAIAEAEVGDDMSGEDPTVNRLEAMCCELFDKPAAVFACSGTQANQMAIWAHCVAGDELIAECTSHVVNYEAGAPAVLSGVCWRTVPGRGGMLDVSDLQTVPRPIDQHFPRTRLLVLENTTNLGGGRVYPPDQLHRVCRWAHEQGWRVHLDGARLMNAVVACGVSAAELCRECDTVAMCFSKGLGCPMGSILVGDEPTIARARRARKIFGGALRQAGIVAAAAVYALEHNVRRLQTDHENARQLARDLAGLPHISLDPEAVETNLVFFDLDPQWGTAAELVARAREHGLKIGALGPQRLRICTHLDVERADLVEAVAILRRCLQP